MEINIEDFRESISDECVYTARMVAREARRVYGMARTHLPKNEAVNLMEAFRDVVDQEIIDACKPVDPEFAVGLIIEQANLHKDAEQSAEFIDIIIDNLETKISNIQ